VADRLKRAAGWYGVPRLEREGRAGEREGTDKDKDTASINNLDNNALNLYTAGRAYGWLNEAARPGGRSPRGWQSRKFSSREEEKS